jgi:hypothetical protein
VLIVHIGILPYIYQRVLIPPFVWEEVQAVATHDPVKAWVAPPPD